MCPKAVAGVSFKYLLTASSERSDQVTRRKFLIGLRRADFVGLNNSLCKQLTNAPVLGNS